MKYLSWLLLAAWSLAAVAQPAPPAPELAAKAYILMDFYSGQILAAKQPDERQPAGAITKLLAAYVIYQRLADGRMDLNDTVPVAVNTQRMPGARMFIEAGTQVPLSALLQGMIVQSANDATLALADYVAGSDSAFVQLLNIQAARMGLDHSHFATAIGLGIAADYTTAHDAAILARALIGNFPQYYGMYAERSYRYNGVTQHSRNKLLWRDPSVDGLASIQSAADHGLVASAQRGDMRLITVVLGTASDGASVSCGEQLLNYGFSRFETYKLYPAGQRLTTVWLWKGVVNRVPLGVLTDVYATIPKGRYHDLAAALRVNALIKAPVRRGQPLGSVVIDLAHRPLITIPLVALKSVPTAGLLGQLADQVLLMFSSMFN